MQSTEMLPCNHKHFVAEYTCIIQTISYQYVISVAKTEHFTKFQHQKTMTLNTSWFCHSHSHLLTTVWRHGGGVAQWLECRSLAAGLSLIYIWSMVDTWPLRE